MQQHRLNVEKSLEVFNYSKMKLEEKECYMNVFNVLQDFKQKFQYGDWKVAYGYWPSLGNNVFARHCFIVNEADEVIDPTLGFLQYRLDVKEHGYYSFAILSKDGYFEKLKAESLYPHLRMSLHKEEKEALKWADNQGVIFVP